MKTFHGCRIHPPGKMLLQKWEKDACTQASFSVKRFIFLPCTRGPENSRIRCGRNARNGNDDGGRAGNHNHVSGRTSGRTNARTDNRRNHRILHNGGGAHTAYNGPDSRHNTAWILPNLSLLYPLLLLQYGSWKRIVCASACKRENRRQFKRPDVRLHCKPLARPACFRTYRTGNKYAVMMRTICKLIQRQWFRKNAGVGLPYPV